MRSIRVLGTAAISLLAVLAISGPSSAAQELRGSHGGNAYGTWANATAGSIATQLGRSAFMPCPCDGTDGEVISTSADNVRSGNVARSNRIDSTARADKTATSAYTRMTSKADGTSLLDGRITANLITAVAKTNASTTGMHSNAKQSRFGGLEVLGTPLNDVAPNTTRAIPGFGHVVLREVQRSGDGVHRSAIAVNMIHLFITRQNSMNIPVGSEIVVGHAQSSYRSREAKTLFSGYAFATSGRSSSDQANNRMGRSAATYLGCTGENGASASNEINRSSAAEGLRAGSGVTSVRGATVGNLSTTVAKSTVENVSLLGGMVAADKVQGVARSTWDHSTNSGSNDFNGSKLVGLRINGTAINRDVAPNTRMNLPGVGYVLLNHHVGRSSADGASAKVAMIEVHVTVAGNLNLPVGSTFLVGVADSSVRPSSR
jgi:hypothetical protein